MAARNSRVLVSKLLAGTSIPIYTQTRRSTSSYSLLQGSLPMRFATSDLSPLGGTSVRAYTHGSTSDKNTCYRIEPEIYRPLDRASTSPSVKPLRLPWRDVFTIDYEKAEIFDKIGDESLDAICCFYDAETSVGDRQQYLITQKLLEQYPHVQSFYINLYCDYDEPTEGAFKELNLSGLPMFHFYRNGKKVAELHGDYIIRFKKVLEKLYKSSYRPSFIGDQTDGWQTLLVPHNRGSNKQSYVDSTFNKFQGTRRFSASVRTRKSNQQSSRDSAFQGRGSFELILSEEYKLNVKRIEDECMRGDAVLCFATYRHFISYFVYSLLYYTIGERFPHVPIYYVLLSRKEDDNKTPLGSFNIFPQSLMPTVLFFKNGSKVAEVSRMLIDDGYCRDMIKTFEKLYKQPGRNKDREEVRGLRGRTFKELDSSVALEDIIKDAGIVHISDMKMISYVKQKIGMIRQQISDRCGKLWP